MILNNHTSQFLSDKIDFITLNILIIINNITEKINLSINIFFNNPIPIAISINGYK